MNFLATISNISNCKYLIVGFIHITIFCIAVLNLKNPDASFNRSNRIVNISF